MNRQHGRAQRCVEKEWLSCVESEQEQQRLEMECGQAQKRLGMELGATEEAMERDSAVAKMGGQSPDVPERIVLRSVSMVCAIAESSVIKLPLTLRKGVVQNFH